jgi:hypothetical protein
VGNYFTCVLQSNGKFQKRDNQLILDTHTTEALGPPKVKENKQNSAKYTQWEISAGNYCQKVSIARKCIVRSSKCKFIYNQSLLITNVPQFANQHN